MQELLFNMWVISAITLPWLGISTAVVVLASVWMENNRHHPLTVLFFKDIMGRKISLVTYSMVTIFYILYRFYGD